MRTNELILYKDMEDGELLQDMTFLMENYNNEYYIRPVRQSHRKCCMHSHHLQEEMSDKYATDSLQNRGLLIIPKVH